MPPKRKASVTKETEESSEAPVRRSRTRSRGGSVASVASADQENERSPKRTRRSSKSDLGEEAAEESAEKVEGDEKKTEAEPEAEPVTAEKEAEAESKPETEETRPDQLEEAPVKEEVTAPETNDEEKKSEPVEEEEPAPVVKEEGESAPTATKQSVGATVPAQTASNAIYGAGAGASIESQSQPQPGPAVDAGEKTDVQDEWYSVTSPDGCTQVIDIPKFKCGSIIGPKGSTISRIQNKSGSNVKLNQDFPEGHPCKLTITGNPESVTVAAGLVRKVLKDGPQAIHDNVLAGGEEITEVLACAPGLVGRVVGRQGANIKEVQSRSGARVQLNQNFDAGVDREVHITGTRAAVTAAAELVKWIMDNGPVLPAPGMPLSGGMGMGMGMGMGGGGGGYGGHGGAGQANVTVECPKACIGRVIGRGGETISRIQRTSNARVQVDQNVPEGAPVKVNITGMEANVQEAIRMVQDVMVNGSGGGARRRWRRLWTAAGTAARLRYARCRCLRPWRCWPPGHVRPAAAAADGRLWHARAGARGVRRSLRGLWRPRCRPRCRPWRGATPGLVRVRRPERQALLPQPYHANHHLGPPSMRPREVGASRLSGSGRERELDNTIRV